MHVAPETRPMIHRASSISHPELRVTSLDFRTFDDLEMADRLEAKQAKHELERQLANSFLHFLQTEVAKAPPTRTSTLAIEVLERPRVSFRVALTASSSHNSTGLLDVILLQPLGPSWGRVRARAKVWADVGSSLVLISDEEISQEYSHVRHWSWRKAKDFREKALVQKLYEKLFTKSAKNIVPLLADLTCVMHGQTPFPLRALTQKELRSLRQDFDEAVARLLALQVTSNRQHIPETGPRVIQSLPVNQTDDSAFARYLDPLGGLELAQRQGTARVVSRARNSSGELETLGTGEATSQGYRIAFYQPPKTTGYFFPPSLGFLSQTITIAGFEEDIPRTSVSNSEDIPGIITDPSSGDISTLVLNPISYGLELKSLYLGQGIGLNLVLGDEDVQYFVSWQAALNLFELRQTNVEIHTSREQGYSFELAKSINASGQLGVYIPAWHLAFRLSGELEQYLDFDFPEVVDFLGRARFNADKQIFERERIFVEGASFTQLNGQLSVTYVF